MENRYDKYKDSGIEWIGEIPEHWNLKRIKNICDNLDYLREPISAEHRSRNNPIYDYYGASGVIDKIDFYNVDDQVLLIGEDGANLVMRNLPLVYKAKGKFWVNNHAHILKPRNDNYDFCAYAFEAADYSLFITGSAQPKLSQENLGRIKIAIPPLPEQQSIATYLDQKCGEIEELIALHEEMITKLQSYKQSVITEAVTKGLDKNIPLKDSGVEWIGEIPEHWEVKRLKNVCFQINIKENSKGNPLPYIGLENIESGSGRYIDTTSEVDGMANRFCKNNVLFGKLRPYLSKVYLTETDGICSTEFIVYDTKSNNCRFIHKLLLSQTFIDVVNSSTYGAKMPRANSEFINNIYVQIPPLSEQQSIADYLDRKCGEIDKLISIKQQKIEKLKDYKKLLIFECVTGKRKVC